LWDRCRFDGLGVRGKKNEVVPDSLPKQPRVQARVAPPNRNKKTRKAPLATHKNTRNAVHFCFGAQKEQKNIVDTWPAQDGRPDLRFPGRVLQKKI